MGVLGANLVVHSGALRILTDTCAAYIVLPIYRKMVGVPVLSVLTIGICHTKPSPYEFLNLYGACMHAPRIPKNR